MAALLLGYNVLWLMSAARLPVRTTNLLFQTTIVLTPLGAALCGLEKLTMAGGMAAVLAIFGVALAAGPSASDSEADVDATGMLLGLGAALGNTVYSLLWKTFGMKTASFVATAYWAVAAVHLLAIPAYPVVVSYDLATPWWFPGTPLLQALMLLSAVLASSVNLLNIFIIAKAGPGVLAVGSAMSIPIAYVMDFVVHGEAPATRELTGCTFIIFALALTLSRPDLSWDSSADYVRRVTMRITKRVAQHFSNPDLTIAEKSDLLLPSSAVAFLWRSIRLGRSPSATDLEAPLLSKADVRCSRL
jgi:drug/metabolite transporter (DMT)-like permease